MSSGSATRSSRGPRSSTTSTTSRRSTTRPGTRRGCSRTPSTSTPSASPMVRRGCSRAQDVLLRTHTSPMQVRAMEAQQPPIFIVVPGTVYRRDTIDATHSPIFHQVEGLAVAEGISLADLAGDARSCARALFGAERETASEARLLPLHRARASRSTSRASPAAARDAARTGRATRSARETAGSRSSAPGWSTRTCSASSRATATTPRRRQGFAFGMGIERIAMLKHRIPDLRLLFDNDVRFLEQFSMKVPFSWLREYCDPGLEPERSPSCSAMSGDRGRARRPVGVALGRRLRRRQGARPSSTRTPTGSASARSTTATASGRSSAAPPTSPPGRPSPSPCPGAMPGGDEAPARRSSAASPRTG